MSDFVFHSRNMIETNNINKAFDSQNVFNEYLDSTLNLVFAKYVLRSYFKLSRTLNLES